MYRNVLIATDLLPTSALALREGLRLARSQRGRPDTLGSVAEQVVRIAGRPVLVVPAEPLR